MQLNFCFTSLLSLFLFFNSASSYSDFHHIIPHHKYKKTAIKINKSLTWQNFKNKYLLAIAGGLIGAATGGMTRYAEKKLGIAIPGQVNFLTVLWIFFAWNLENDVREVSIESIRQDLGAEQGHRNLTSIYARIASWITYLALHDL